ncbi:hypothetical protein [Thiosocius teredinicola]|uniref:hypothetical protein n=1 Tax=Thiosocius teredinicola TaxID=1973002 RepID=UPI000F76AE28
MNDQPPYAIACTRPIAWAKTQPPVKFTGRQCLIVDGERLGQVPILVIAQADNSDILILHCDEEWRVLGIVGCASVDEAKQKAESYYEGISGLWQETGYTEEQTEAYLDEVFSEDACTFCGIRPDQVWYFYAFGRGSICEKCIVQFHELMQSEIEKEQ